MGKQLTGTLSKKTWTGLTSFYGDYIWKDGDNVYYSNSTYHYVLDKSTSTWSTKTWKGLTDFTVTFIWTDGDNVYYSYNSDQYVLDRTTSTWNRKTWNGLTQFGGDEIWTDGNNIYYSAGASYHYVLNRATSTWEPKTWYGLTNFEGRYIWSDGDNLYYYNGYNDNYVLNKETSTWESKIWNGLQAVQPTYIWTDGKNTYYSQNADSTYILDSSTSTWEPINFDFSSVSGGFSCRHIWSDGDNLYYSWMMSNQYVFDTIDIPPISIPTISPSTYTYTGSAITPTITGYDSAKMTQGGVTSATNVGSYTMTFALNDSEDEWTDGTTGTKYLTWYIENVKSISKEGLASIITKINTRLDNRYTKAEVDNLIISSGGGTSGIIPINPSDTSLINIWIEDE